MESPDQIVAKRKVVGQTSTGDWDLIENDYSDGDPVYIASPAATITNLSI